MLPGVVLLRSSNVESLGKLMAGGMVCGRKAAPELGSLFRMEQQPHVNSGGEATCAVGGQAHLCACVGRRCPPGAPLAVCFTVTYCFGELARARPVDLRR